MRYSKLKTLIFATLTSLTGASEAATIVYNADFETPVGLEWSNTSRSATPGTALHATDRFLGEFGNTTVRLTLSNLAPHTQVTLAFDLFIIRTWDGNGLAGDGPDNFDVKVQGGPTLLDTNFAWLNDPGRTQAYPNMLPPLGPGGAFAPGTGASESYSLGYSYFGIPADWVYSFNLTFASSASTLVFEFHGAPNESIGNESWGLNDVQVSIDAVPEPSSVLSMSIGIFAVAAFAQRGRRASSCAQPYVS